jgi:hypothetical protein
LRFGCFPVNVQPGPIELTRHREASAKFRCGRRNCVDRQSGGRRNRSHDAPRGTQLTGRCRQSDERFRASPARRLSATLHGRHRGRTRHPGSDCHVPSHHAEPDCRLATTRTHDGLRSLCWEHRGRRQSRGRLLRIDPPQNRAYLRGRGLSSRFGRRPCPLQCLSHARYWGCGPYGRFVQCLCRVLTQHSGPRPRRD